MREAEGHKLVKLRNPWGESEWAGDWGDNSPLWTQKMKSLLSYTGQRDGVFWMSFEDFTIQFQRVYICRIFDHIFDESNPNKEFPKGAKPWYRQKVTGKWEGETAAGCPAFIKDGGTPEKNPQYVLTLLDSRPAVVFITMTQPTQADMANYLKVGLLVADKGGKRVITLNDSRTTVADAHGKAQGADLERGQVQERARVRRGSTPRARKAIHRIRLHLQARGSGYI